MKDQGVSKIEEYKRYQKMLDEGSYGIKLTTIARVLRLLECRTEYAKSLGNIQNEEVVMEYIDKINTEIKELLCLS